jgi:4'-phosphopantetheinyl transferase
MPGEQPSFPYPHHEPMFASTTELHVWRAQLNSDGWPSADCLPSEERERATSLHRPPARKRWVAARWALRGVLSHYLEEAPAEIELRVRSNGKPMLSGPSVSLRFNLSHSGDRALVAIARGREIGVDIERIEPRRDILALARRALGPAEAAEIRKAGSWERSALFHAAWTRREALAKCFGTGLGAPLPAAAVTVSALDAGPGFAAAIAVSGDVLPPLRHFTMEPRRLAAGASIG